MERDPMEMALSTEIVLDNVLSHLDVKDLLACRYVSKFWNKAASSVLRQRSTMIKKISKTTALKKLEQCLKQSRDFPFTGLKFDQPWELSSAGAIKFFKKYGARFTNLRVGAWPEARLQDQAPFINHLPRLSILETGWYGGLPSRAQLLDSAAGQEDARILNLPALRTLRISSYVNEGVLREVCTAASPALRIECLVTSYKTLKALKRSGNLQAVSVIKLALDAFEEDYALRVDTLLSNEPPALTKLNFLADGCISREGLIRLLISSQHTLKELSLTGMCPSELSSECPVLPKLTTLRLWIDQREAYLFEGSHGHKFPALKEFKLNSVDGFSSANLSDGLFIVPSLTKIDLDGYVDKAGIEDLAQCFPNVIEIKLTHYAYEFGYFKDSNPMEIWSVGAFKFLEKLRIWDCNVAWPARNYDHSKNPISLKTFRNMNMDSFLTGIPIGMCENLRKYPQQNLTGSPFNEILRDTPSLLQLKNLKELTVCVDVDNKLEELPEEPLFISMVSAWYALEMMPNLEAKFVYNLRSLSWRFREEQRDKAVKLLKGAFRHVQPYLKLEPFFY